MKIAIVCPNDFTIVQFCGALVEFLQDGGNNTVYAVCDVHGAHGENTNGHYTDVTRSWGVVHLPIKYYRFLSVKRDAQYIVSLYTQLRRERFDLVVNIATKANVYGSVVARLVGIKHVVCSVWGLGATFNEAAGLRPRLLKALVTFLYRLGFKASSKVWFTNEHDYNWFISAGIVDSAKAFLTKNYVNTDTYSPGAVTDDQRVQLRTELGLSEQNRVVVMVARMSWAKGVKEFIEAAAILGGKYPLIKFILIGPMDDGSPDSVPEAYLRENERYGNFIWTGFRRDVQTFYSLSALAVLPSYYREGGFPRGLTEAMAMGKPIITTDSVHCRATVEDGKNGYHVPIKDSMALARAIETIVADDDTRERFGRYSRMKAVNEFDERKVVAQVAKELLSVATYGRAPTVGP